MGVRVRALSFHAGYGCRSSGACCTAGWEIPVEPATEERIAEAAASGALRAGDGSPAGDWARPLPGPPAPGGARIALRTLPSGCVFFDAAGTRLCAVQQRLGEGTLPSACRHFPRVVTLTPLGVSVTLSHYCPTAASLLFDEAPGGRAADRALRIVEAPAAFPASWPYEGLDARDALPPLLRPGVLMTWPSLERWEEHSVSALGRAGPPESALAQLSAAAEAARGWTPADGEFDAHFASCLAARHARAPGGEASRAWSSEPRRAWELVASSVPVRALVPPPPPALAGAAAALVEAGWPGLAPVASRWLAAHAFGSWLALQGKGLRTTVGGLALALGVLRAEAGRACVDERRPLDAALLGAALRRADLLLRHLADPQALAGRLSRCEAAC